MKVNVSIMNVDKENVFEGVVNLSRMPLQGELLSLSFDGFLCVGRVVEVGTYVTLDKKKDKSSYFLIAEFLKSEEKD